MAYVYGAPRDPTAVVGRRIVAYVIDGLLVLIAVLVVLSLVKHDTFTDAPADACSILRARHVGDSYHVMCVRIASRAWLWERSDFLLATSVAAGIGILDVVVLQAATGASVGKHALGLLVVDAQGARAGIGPMIVRLLLLVLDGGIFLVGLIAVLSTGFHRRVGDLAAGTFVVAKASAGQPVALAPTAVQYGGAVFAAPGAGAGTGFAAPAAPTSFAPGRGGTEAPAPAAPPAPSALPSVAWNAPPAAAPAPAPAPAPSMPPPPVAPASTLSPPPAPISTTAPPVAPPPRPPVPEPATAPARQPELQPEAWWDTAVPTEPPDGEAQP
ncbi:MAG TPA: RDD family protein [Acidimicrobiia bacterium]|nr:RDD family protein [Acidimicrobiia bacterium]